MSSAQPFRLASGGTIDRSRPLTFRFDGKSYQGFEGDTLASALLANGVRVTGRSFRYHRPRGIFAAGVEEPSVVVQIGSGANAEPNLKATEVLLYDGLEARAVNAWPNARFDIGAITGLFSALLSPGFYYKTFMWPRWSWFSGAIRRMGGLGQAPREIDPALYGQIHDFCDVLVVGAGPAGLSAALAAARSGARTVLVDSQPEFGSSLVGGADVIDGQPAQMWSKRAVVELGAMANAVLLPRCTAFGYYDHNTLGLIETGGSGQTLHTIRARHVVLATGAYERPLLFRNNDRPNIMLASAAQTYLHRYGVTAGHEVVITTNNDSVYALALELKAQGVTVAAVADLRSDPPLAASLIAAGIRVLAGYAPVNARGRGGIRAVELAQDGGNGPVRIACDLLCVSGGWNPVVHLFSQSGGRIRYEADTQCFVPDAWTQDGTAAGAVTGEFSLGGALREGTLAGLKAAREAGFAPVDIAAPAATDATPSLPKVHWRTNGKERGRAWVDLLNDVTVADVRQAVQENYRSVEHLKRYTTLGMAVDQGKTSNINAIGVLSDVLEKPISEIGTTKFRPPFNPVRFGALAAGRTGHFLHPLKQLPSQHAQEELGAVMEDYGGWARPAFYPKGSENEEAAIRREALCIRNGVGLYDASPLGKIRVAGPDAALLLDRVFVGMMSTLKPGRCRYGIMLHENGTVFDDGVVMRISEHEFLVGTTSGHASAVLLWLEEWLQCEWTSLVVATEDVTAQWATVTIAGPKALALLVALNPSGAAIADETLPHMTFRDGALGKVLCRIARVSFTGERSYEVSVPAAYGDALWRQCLKTGRALDAEPVGLEAVMRLRMEKGFLHIGSDTDGTTFPQDLGFAKAIAAKTGDFIGRRSTMLPEAVRTGRHQFVGLEPLVAGQTLVAGAHVVHDGHSDGWITSAGFSPSLGKFVALGMVADGRSRIGETVTLQNLGVKSQARLCNPCFYDPQGARIRA